jgi:hypothetical protein
MQASIMVGLRAVKHNLKSFCKLSACRIRSVSSRFRFLEFRIGHRMSNAKSLKADATFRPKAMARPVVMVL